MKYERFTRRDEFGVIALCNACKRKATEMCYAEDSEGVCCLNEGLERLAELEDDLESGKIIRLPCKVGDTVYFIIKSGNEFVLLEDTCIGFTIADGEIYIGLENIPVAANKYYFTREEAEAKLKELQNK